KDMTLQEIFRERTDIDIEEVIEQYTEMLGTGIVNIVNLFRPQLVLLGGAMSEYADTLIPSLRKMMEEDSFGGRHGMIPEIGVAELGDEAGMIGAANL
ncbi:MAG: ROK family protein, partial [Solobacterium sp.]|nr:ROK family protein [Solobacterium sp.]